MRLLVAGDPGLLAALLTRTLAGLGFTMLECAADLVRLPTLVDRHRPDVVLLDALSDTGMRAAGEVRARYPDVGLLVLGQRSESGYPLRLLALGGGALGYLVKDRVHDVTRLVDAIDRVRAGEVVVDPEVLRRVIAGPRRDPLHELTPGERAVLALMAEGRSNTAIARQLGHSPKTVEKRVTALARKLGLPQPDGQDRADVNVRVLAVLTYLRGRPV